MSRLQKSLETVVQPQPVCNSEITVGEGTTHVQYYLTRNLAQFEYYSLQHDGRTRTFSGVNA